MNIQEAENLAEELFQKFGLSNWKFEWDSGKKRFGHCRHWEKTISLSHPLTILNSKEVVHSIILHEISHALVGPGHGHGPVWKRKAVEIGCSSDRCYDSSEVVQPKAPITLVCPNCGKEIGRWKRSFARVSCSDCCNRYNEGRFSEKFVFQLQTFSNCLKK